MTELLASDRMAGGIIDDFRLAHVPVIAALDKMAQDPKATWKENSETPICLLKEKLEQAIDAASRPLLEERSGELEALVQTLSGSADAFEKYEGKSWAGVVRSVLTVDGKCTDEADLNDEEERKRRQDTTRCKLPRFLNLLRSTTTFISNWSSGDHPILAFLGPIWLVWNIIIPRTCPSSLKL